MLKDCHDTALNYLAHRERSAFEMKSHLCSRGFQEEEIDKELQYLKELHYVDDERYCEEYLRYSMQKGRGPVRLQFELKKKGIAAELIQRYMEDHFDMQKEKEAALNEAKKLICKRSEFGQDSDEEEAEERNFSDEKTIAKIGRKLASLGYHSEVIYDVIGQIRKF